MKKWYILITCLFSFALEARDIALREVRPVMDMFFDLHVESKSFSPSLTKRFIKVYIDQFDAEKIYLLKSEISPYINMSDEQALRVMQKIERNDFSDFLTLRQLFAKAIIRARQVRSTPISIDSKGPFTHKWPDYAESEEALGQRQIEKFQKFFFFQQKRFGAPLSKEKQVRLFALLEKKLCYFENVYLSEKENKITTQILKAFAKSLDAHTSYFSDEEAFEMRVSLEKQFEGYGVVLSENIDGVYIAGLVKGSPAEECKLIRLQDRVVEIDRASVADLSLEEVLDAMKSNKTKEITLGFQRDNDKTIFRVLLTKRPIAMQDDRLTYSSEPFADGVIATLHLNAFYENDQGLNSEKDIREALSEIQKKGPIKGIVLDLRENSGGFLNQAVKVAGIFMSSGVVAVSKYSKGELRYLRNVYPKSSFSGPLVILTSKMSASAAEIVAQALQDYGIALIVGDERTFGKGSIQYQTVTKENAELYFKVTVGKYYTASGKTTQIEGVKADIVVPSEVSYFRYGERYLEYPLPADTISPCYKDSLSDLDPASRTWFEYLYLPNLQNPKSFWHDILPTLKENSQKRLANNTKFQQFLEEQKKKDPNEMILSDKKEGNKEDLQLTESKNILMDMIQMEEADAGASAGKTLTLEKK